jgi:hypothetical protein
LQAAGKTALLGRTPRFLEGCALHGQVSQVLLQLFLRCFLKTGELDTHAYSAIARPDNRGGFNSTRIQPKSDGYGLFQGERHPPPGFFFLIPRNPMPASLAPFDVLEKLNQPARKRQNDQDAVRLSLFEENKPLAFPGSRSASHNQNRDRAFQQCGS